MRGFLDPGRVNQLERGLILLVAVGVRQSSQTIHPTVLVWRERESSSTAIMMTPVLTTSHRHASMILASKPDRNVKLNIVLPMRDYYTDTFQFMIDVSLTC